MARAIENVRAHYKETRGEPRIVKAPEWGLDLHIGKMTLREFEQIREGTERSSARGMLATIIARSKDADGKPVFSMNEIDVLLREADFEVVKRVATEINEDLIVAELGAVGEG